jgi:hypothetical protein
VSVKFAGTIDGLYVSPEELKGKQLEIVVTFQNQKSFNLYLSFRYKEKLSNLEISINRMSGEMIEILRNFNSEKVRIKIERVKPEFGFDRFGDTEDEWTNIYGYLDLIEIEKFQKGGCKHESN